MLSLVLNIVATISVLYFLIRYYFYTKNHKDNKKWIKEFIGSYVFWHNSIPDKTIRYSLLASYSCFWIMFVFLLNNWLIFISTITVYFVGMFISTENKTVLSKIHNGILQASIWTSIVFVLVRSISHWYISIPALCIPLIPYFMAKYKKQPLGITNELITFDVLYLWLVIFTILS